MPGLREGVAASTPHAPAPRFPGSGDTFPLKRTRRKMGRPPPVIFKKKRKKTTDVEI